MAKLLCGWFGDAKAIYDGGNSAAGLKALEEEEKEMRMRAEGDGSMENLDFGMSWRARILSFGM